MLLFGSFLFLFNITAIDNVCMLCHLRLFECRPATRASKRGIAEYPSCATGPHFEPRLDVSFDSDALVAFVEKYGIGSFCFFYFFVFRFICDVTATLQSGARTGACELFF